MMKYASTFTDNGVERVVVILPLSAVPGFDPESPPQPNTYAVPDDVQVGWVKQGGVFVAPPPPSVVVPTSVTRRQFKRQLHLMGLLETVQAIIDGANDPLLLIDWNEAQDFERSNPFVAQMAVALGKTEAEIDQFFIDAKQL